jgi:hypothetical protein
VENSHLVHVIFDWEKGANGGVVTWMFSELVLSRDSWFNGWFLVDLVSMLKD